MLQMQLLAQCGIRTHDQGKYFQSSTNWANQALEEAYEINMFVRLGAPKSVNLFSYAH